LSNVGFATLSIIPSAKGFASALGGEVNPAMSRAGKEGGGLFGKSLLPSIGGLAVAAGGLFAAAGVGGFFKDAVAGAANLEQSVGAIETVFKTSAPQMLSWADGAATAVGLTKNEYAELGTLIGTQLRNGGTAMDELAPKTNNLIGLGADLSSMFGGTTSDAVSALSSALKGERDPIERYGVSLTQAAVDAKAAELGFAKVGGTLSAEANQAATLALIMDQTSDAHGNFGRESDTLAHKQQVLNALWQDGKTRIGGALVPAISALTGTLISGLGPALDGAERGIKTVTEVVGGVYGILAKGDFKPFAGLQEDSAVVDVLFRIREGVLSAVDGIGGAISKIAPYVAPIAAVIGGLALNFLPLLGLGGRIATAFAPMLATIGKLAPLLRVAAGPVGIVVGLLGALIASSPELQGQLMGLVTTIGSSLAPIFSTLAGAVSGLLPVITGALATLGPVFTGLLATLAPALSTVVGLISSVLAAVLPLAAGLLGQLVPVITQLVTAVLPPVVAIFGQIITAIAPLVVQLVNALVPVLLDVVTAILPVVSTIAGLLIPIISNLMPVVTTVFGVIASVISAVMQVISGVIQVVTGVISGNWSQVWTGIQSIFAGVWNLVVSILTGAVAIVGAVIRAALANIAAVWSAAWNGLVGLVSGAWSGITGAISSGVSSAVSFVSGLPGKILSALSSLGSMLISVGSNMMQGLIQGVQAVAGRIKDAVLGPIKDSVDAVKGFLGIHSPSRLFIGIGEFTGQGMAIGLQNSAGLIARASDALIPTVPETAYAAPAVRPGGLYGAAGQRSSGGDTHITVYEAVDAAATAADVARRKKGQDA
jgi:phage-related protein